MKNQIGYWIQGSAYHLCRDREILSTYATCERLERMANNTTNRVVGKGIVRFCMADEMFSDIDRVEEFGEFFKGNKEMLLRRKTRRLYRLEGSAQTGELLSDMGLMVLASRMDMGSNSCTKARQSKHRVLGGYGMYRSAKRCFEICAEVCPNSSGAIKCRNVQLEAQKKETKSILRSCTTTGRAAAETSLFALNLISAGESLQLCA
ncbi:hypothetical protein Acr_26g0002180 [Actinidia rufa]|uniref:Uncharacterized protein n=1 Tax=Actinidia rufa TaxID=165716 RepID=A0A7J0H1R9_9ERIC|nr:hypothetical protein Acr_26g0002180 [Actinidia rufa]